MDLCIKRNQHLNIREVNFDGGFPGIRQMRQSLSNGSSSEGTLHRRLSAQNPTLTCWLSAKSNSGKYLLQNSKGSIAHHLIFNG